MWTVKIRMEQAPPGKRPRPGKKAAVAHVTAYFTDGAYTFIHEDKVEPDDTSEREAWKTRALAALAAERDGIAQTAKIEEELAALLNEPFVLPA